MLVSALAATPMTPNAGSIAPYARPRAMWQTTGAPMSAAFGLGLGSPFACVTSATDHKNQGTEINAKDHAARRSPEKTST
jgi:hypothetical protein